MLKHLFLWHTPGTQATQSGHPVFAPTPFIQFLDLMPACLWLWDFPGGSQALVHHVPSFLTWYKTRRTFHHCPERAGDSQHRFLPVNFGTNSFHFSTSCSLYIPNVGKEILRAMPPTLRHLLKNSRQASPSWNCLWCQIPMALGARLKIPLNILLLF